MNGGPGDAADAAADEQVRARLAGLGEDDSTAPPIPPQVRTRVVAALRGAPPRHSTGARAPRTRRPSARVAAGIGGSAVIVAAVLGTAMLIGDPGPPQQDPGPTALRMIEPPQLEVPLTEPELLALLDDTPQLGALADTKRLAACLAGLGYPAGEKVLGARPVEIAGQSGIVLVLPGDPPDTLSALVVRPTCSSVDTGLLASTQLRRA